MDTGGFDEPVLSMLAFGMLNDLPHGRLTHIYHGTTREMVGCNFTAHYFLPRLTIRRARRPVPREGDRRVLSAALPFDPLLFGAAPRVPGIARVGVVTASSFASLDVPSAVEESNDPPTRESEEITARSSLRAMAELCGGPMDIAAQIDASTIQAGSARENLRFNSR